MAALNNVDKWEYVRHHWQLIDGKVYSLMYKRPVAFSSKNTGGRGGCIARHNGKNLIIQEHQAVWMLSNKQAIPDNFVIHHQDLDYTNNAPENLILLSKRAHQFYHRYIKGAKGYRYDPVTSQTKPWVARVSLPIGRLIVYRSETEEEARNFVSKHQLPMLKALKAKGCLLLEDIAIN
ncbi:TPA: hypothetical protein JS316_000192 [Escherichia coli]|nr:hypothetical protein [Escherichia coli]